jgi:hypothetical protein
MFLLAGSALAQDERDRALMVPIDSVPQSVRTAIEREAGGRRFVVMRMRIGDTDVYEGDFAGERLRVTDDGRILGRDLIR